jgi:serine/threonine-protein kinase
VPAVSGFREKAQLQRIASYDLACEVASWERFASYLGRKLGDVAGQDLLIHVYEQTDPTDLEHWLKRARAVAESRQENVVPILDLGVDDSSAYLVSPFLECRNLVELWNRCVRDGVPIPIDVSIWTASQLCRAFSSLPPATGDFKYSAVPKSAIVIGSSGHVMIDFGLASLQRRKGMAHHYALRYFSPEEVRGDALDSRSSVYAVGIVLWEMLTGRALFPRFGRLIPRRHIREEDIGKRPYFGVVSPGAIKRYLPEELEAICCVALRTNPRRRFANCDELGGELDRLLATRGADGVEVTATLMTKLFATEFAEELESRESWRANEPPN